MKKILYRISYLFFIASLVANFLPSVLAQEISPIEPFQATDRVLVLAPHPDDETIGCAGVIQRAVKAGAQVKVAYLTNGDHNELAFAVYAKRPIIFNREFVAMGQVREEEAKKAMKLLGLKEDNLIFLGYPDYGTDTIFFSFWGNNQPFASFLTRQPDVPYKESPSYGAPYKGESILGDLKKVLLEYQPNKIFVSHPADVNGDHWAYYCFLQIALLDLRAQIPAPKLYVYFIHGPGWPVPRHYHPELSLQPSEKHFRDKLIKWSELKLTPEEIEKKYQATLSYRSQTCVSAFYLLAFARQNELFGDYPLITLKKEKSSGHPDTQTIFQDNNPVSYAIIDNSFWVRVRKPPELKHRLFFSFYIFGYNDKVPYDEMPNINVLTKYEHIKIREMSTAREVNPEGTSAQVGRDYFILKIPLETLGNPSFILTSLTTDKPFLSLEAIGFRRIEIKD